jgi:hypothetical protein
LVLVGFGNYDGDRCWLGFSSLIRWSRSYIKCNLVQQSVVNIKFTLITK